MEEKRKRASELRKMKNFSEAIDILSPLWENNQTDKWLGWEYALCLKGVGESAAALPIVEQVYTIDSEFNYNNNLYAWIINDIFFKEMKQSYTNQEVHELLEKAQLICKLIRHDETKSPIEFCVLRAIKTAKKVLPKLPSELILELLENLDINLLSTKNYEVEIKGRFQEMQSNKEYYYSIKTKVLLDLERYEDCLRCCDEALSTIESFHHSNDVWIEERKTQCIASLGNLASAIEILKKLVIEKESWYLLSSLAELYWSLADPINASLYFCRAALSRDPDEMKVSLYEKIGDLLMESGNVDMADKHYVYAQNIRVSKEWQVPFRLRNKIKDPKLLINKKELLSFWLEKIYLLLEVRTGNVLRMLPNNKMGFISSAKCNYFFKSRNIVGKSNLKIGDNVKFVLTESYDAKKHEESLEANYITIN